LRDKLYTMTLVLVMTVAAIFVAVPSISAQINVNMQIMLYPIIGENSPTYITWEPSPNVFLSDPYYVEPWTETPMWSDAVITFTRPDSSVDVVNGPFTVYSVLYSSGSWGFHPQVELTYTPDMQGDWTVNFYWPGDGTYNPINVTNTFPVGPHHPKRISYPMMSIRPYPAVGIGQEVLVNHFVTPPPMNSRENYRNYEFTIKKPDGSTYYSFTMDSEVPGVVWFNFWPDTLGEWSISFNWDGSYFMLPCNITRTFTVQQDPIPYPVEDTPIPTTEPWDYPVSVFNREWRNIAGPWLAAAYNSSRTAWNPYTEAPRSAHIRWMLPPTSGIGGYIGSYTSDYVDTNNIFASSRYRASAAGIGTIMAGNAYYAAGGNIYAVDIMTGETVWERPGSAMSIIFLGSFLQGATRSSAPVLYYMGNDFIVYDALTGAEILNVPGMPMFLFDDPYVISAWPSAFAPTNWICWTTEGNTANFADRVIWNVTDPYIQHPYMPPFWTWDYYIHQGLLVYQTQKYSQPEYASAVMEDMVAFNMTNGDLVYAKHIVDDSDPQTWWVQQGPARGTAYGLYFYSITGDPSQIDPPDTSGGYIAWNVSTGELAWLSEPFDVYPWGSYFAYNPECAGYGMIYPLSYSGVWALNATNGKVVWHYTAGDSGMETPYNTWPFGSTGPILGGGVLFAPSTEHSPTLYYRGTRLHAIDAYTGDGLWTILGYYTPTAIAEGTLIASESTLGYTYAFGKGESAIEVSVSPSVIANGSSVLIQGTITDQSPAQPGTACVSKESMTAWMEYLHMQQPCPDSVTGVPVDLYATCSDGSVISIGTVRNDMTGQFAYLWTPPTEDVYKIVAVFVGDESYWSSYAETALGVEAAPPAPEEPTEPPEPTPGLSLVEIALIVAVVIVAIIAISAVILVRKRRK